MEALSFTAAYKYKEGERGTELANPAVLSGLSIPYLMILQ